MANNIGKLYYKDYYNGINFTDVIAGRETPIGGINDRIKESPLLQIPAPIDVDDEKYKPFPATTLYPGLVTGVGIEHGSKKITGGYELGMHFDYTMGMPIIYGSSVKGVLRTYFKEFYEGDIDADKLIEDIFCGKNDGIPKPIYERDIFFDAVITESCNGTFLADDSITPHIGGPLKNPIPIAMLKIAPGCTLEFRFRLCNTVVGGMKFSIADKFDLFKKILTTVGIGAKTNVGYGQLSEVLKKKKSKDVSTQQQECTGTVTFVKAVGFQVVLDDAKYANSRYILEFESEQNEKKVNKKKPVKVKVSVLKTNNKVRVIFKGLI